jgi:hypothetical protein
MKTKFFLITLILSASYILQSCTKTGIRPEDVKNTSPAANKVKPRNNPSKQLFGLNWIMDESTYTCYKVPLDCYDVVDIRPSNSTELSAFNALNAAVQSNDIKGYFTSDYWSVIFPGLEATASLDSLQTGHYGITCNYNSGTKIWYYLAGNILPVTPANKDFVLQVQMSDE